MTVIQLLVIHIEIVVQNKIVNCLENHESKLQQKNLILVISALSGKAVWPLVSKPQMRLSPTTMKLRGWNDLQYIVLTWTWHKWGPDIVRPPVGVRTSVEVGSIVADEADSIGSRIICKHSLIILVVLLALLQELSGCTKSLLMPISKWSFIFSDNRLVSIFC